MSVKPGEKNILHLLGPQNNLLYLKIGNFWDTVAKGFHIYVKHCWKQPLWRASTWKNLIHIGHEKVEWLGLLSKKSHISYSITKNTPRFAEEFQTVEIFDDSNLLFE